MRYSQAGAPRSAGFTLAELMVTLVIGAILVSIAIPAYTSQMQKSRRTEAKSAVMDLATREEQYFSTNNVYSTDPTQLGYAAAGSGAAFPQSTGQYYQITVAVTAAAPPNTPATFIVTATPAAGSVQLSDSKCQSFSVNQLGVQSALDSGGAASTVCWP